MVFELSIVLFLMVFYLNCSVFVFFVKENNILQVLKTTRK